MHRSVRSLAACFAVAAAVALPLQQALAQGVTGSAVTGVITDPSGGPIEGATVTLKNNETGATFHSASGSNGIFIIDNVPPGKSFTLTATFEGMEPTTETGITLALGQKLKVNLQLRLGAEQVEIVAHLDQLDDKARTGASTRVSEPAINTLPLQGRNFSDLFTLDPRASGAPGGGNSVGGQSNKFNSVLIDGGGNSDLFGLTSQGTPGGQANAKPLSIEAVKEFNILVAPFDVRYGSFAGGVVNAITKSGTNDLHGTIFGYYQQKYFAGRQNDPTFLDYNTEQYGFAVGGPIVKDLAHFFIATDLQTKTSSFGNSFQLTGNDANDLKTSGFTNGIAQRFAQILHDKYGIAAPGTALSTTTGNPDKNIFLKVTSSALENSQIELSYNRVNANADILGRNPLSSYSLSASLAQRSSTIRDGYQMSTAGYGQGNETNTVRGKVTTNWDNGHWSNEFLASGSFIRDQRNISQNTPLILVKATCSDPTLCPVGSGTVGASDAFLAAGGERFSQANILNQNIYMLQDSLSYQWKTHKFTAGTQNQFFSFQNLFLQAAIGAWSFDSLDSLAAGTPTAYQKNLAVSSAQAPGLAMFDVQQWGGYVQDEWTPLPNLTITPGVRVDVPLLSRGTVNPILVNNTAFPIDTSQVPSGNPLWSPRLGLNWDVFGNSDTVVRGGVGIFSGPPPYVWVSNAYLNNGLAQVALSCTPAKGQKYLPFGFTADPNLQPTDCTGGTGASKPPTNQGEIDYFDPKTKYPQNLRFALGADQRLPFGIVASVDLMYTRDVNGWYITDANLTQTGTDAEGRTIYGNQVTNTTTGVTSLSPNRIDGTNLGPAIKISNMNGGYTYSGTFSLSKQFGQYFNVTAGYTYSRSYDLISFTSSQAFSNFQFEPVDGSLEGRNVRPSAFDRPHRVVIAATANIPVGVGILGIGLNFVGQSGTPYSWVVSGDINGDGGTTNDLVFVPSSQTQISLADTTKNGQPYTKDQQYQDLQSFISTQDCLAAARGSLLQRGACRNPWQNFLDMRLTWSTPEWKGQHFEVQWDIFNVLNLISELKGPFAGWGHFDQVSGFENGPSQFLKAVGYDTANNRPLYTFSAPTINTTVYSPTLSRWRMQFGARYIF